MKIVDFICALWYINQAVAGKANAPDPPKKICKKIAKNG